MPSLFQTLLHPDRDGDPERALVADAANLLEIGEFQLLQLAYYEWHGRDPGREEMERLFAEYMFRHRIAPWLRHFARGVLGQSQAGRLDARAPCWHRYDAPEPPWRRRAGMGRFLAACSVTLGLLVVTVWLGHVTTRATASLFPPYSAGPGTSVHPGEPRLD